MNSELPKDVKSVEIQRKTIKIINELCSKAQRKNAEYIWFSDILHVVVEFAEKHFEEIEWK